MLRGHKLPGRGNYRVIVDDFIAFLQKQQMPVPENLARSSIVNKRILIVDDETALLNAVCRVLQPLKCKIITAFDGFQAGVLINAEQPDLIILDLSMPGLNGYEVIQFVRNSPVLSRTHILVLSGLQQAELAKAIRLGANDAIAKPFDNKDLFSRVKKLLS